MSIISYSDIGEFLNRERRLHTAISDLVFVCPATAERDSFSPPKEAALGKPVSFVSRPALKGDYAVMTERSENGDIPWFLLLRERRWIKGKPVDGRIARYGCSSADGRMYCPISQVGRQKIDKVLLYQ